MQTALLSGSSKSDFSLLIELAKKLGIKATMLTIEEKEDYALGKAIEEGRESGYVAEKEVAKKLKKIIGK